MRMLCCTAAAAILAIVLFACKSTREDTSGNTRIMKYSALAIEAPPPDVSEDRPGDDQFHRRMVIMTAELEMEVVHYDDVLARVQQIAQVNGGFVVQSATHAAEGTIKSGESTLRIPSASFTKTLDELKSLAANVENVAVRGNDVTEEFYDLDARLKNMQIAELRYQQIIKVAKKVKEILEVEQALTDIRQHIEQLTARKKYLHDQTDLSTISIKMHEPRPLQIAEEPGIFTKLRDGFRRGVTGLGDLAGATTTVLVAAGPFLIFILAIVFITLRFLRRGQENFGNKS